MEAPSSSGKAPERPISAIDIGTNSVHLVVARATPLGPLDVLAREKEKVRLGSGGYDMKQLDPDAVARAVAAIRRFAGIAEAHDAEVVAVATSAVREADDPGAFLATVAAETGVEVDVIAGTEEARLIHLGAISAVPTGEGNHLVIDIGGGSTEIVVGQGTTAILARSLKLGHLRLTDRFLPDGVADPAAIESLRTYLAAFLAPVARKVLAAGHEQAIGCSGTIENTATLAAHLEGRPVGSIDNLRLTREGVDLVVDALRERPRPEQRASMRGLDEHRADVIVAGAELLAALFATLEIREMVVSPNALREGVVLDRLRRRSGTVDALHHLGDLRARSVMAVAARYEEDVTHAQHATDLALELFDATGELHGLGEQERQVLEAAGLLHNVGRFVAHAAHHKHSYYLIRHSEHLLGFTEHELDLIATVARYHRKSAPRQRHPEFAALSADDQQAVSVLAGLLRVGIGLDRTYRRAVRSVTAVVGDDEIEVLLTVEPGGDIELELYTARDRAGLLEKSLDREVRFTGVSDRHTRPAHPVFRGTPPGA